MKTKVLKFGLPLAVCMLAIVCAFASQSNNASNEDAALIGFVYNDAETQCVTANKNCAIFGGIPCQQLDGKNVYRFTNPSGTMCSVSLYEWPEE